MNRTARTTDERSGNIYQHSLANLSDEARAILPSSDVCKRTIRNQRPQQFVQPAQLNMLGDLPDSLTRTTYDDNFIIGDNGLNRADRIIIFGSDRALRLLHNAQVIHMDGNFKIAPTIFSQVYVVRTRLQEIYITVAYAPLPNKGGATYRSFIQLLKAKCTQLGVLLNPTASHLCQSLKCTTQCSCYGV